MNDMYYLLMHSVSRCNHKMMFTSSSGYETLFVLTDVVDVADVIVDCNMSIYM